MHKINSKKNHLSDSKINQKTGIFVKVESESLFVDTQLRQYAIPNLVSYKQLKGQENEDSRDLFEIIDKFTISQSQFMEENLRKKLSIYHQLEDQNSLIVNQNNLSSALVNEMAISALILSSLKPQTTEKITDKKIAYKEFTIDSETGKRVFSSHEDARKYWKKRCERKITLLLKKYWEKFPEVAHLVKRPEIVYDLQGKCAGQAHMPAYKIRLNLDMCVLNGDEFVAHTPGHELAHLIASVVNKNRKLDHSKFWRKEMLNLDLEPLIYHNYNIEGLVKNRKARVNYSANRSSKKKHC